MTRTGVLEQYRPKLETVVPAAPVTRRKTRKWTILSLLLAAAAGVAVWRITATPAAPAYGTAIVTRQTITKSISATGTLQALTTVQVGTQASGTIAEVYADFNSHVKKGQVIA